VDFINDDNPGIDKDIKIKLPDGNVKTVKVGFVSYLYHLNFFKKKYH